MVLLSAILSVLENAAVKLSLMPNITGIHRFIPKTAPNEPYKYNFLNNGPENEMNN